METFIQDLRFALRILLKSPGFTAVAVLTLALGIGANTAIFTVINAVLLRPLPFQDPSRLVSIISTRNLFSAEHVAEPPLAAYFAIKAQTEVFSDTTTFQYNQVNITGAAEPQWLTSLAVPADFFPMLGIPPMRGRTFVAGEEQPGQDLVAVLSYPVWQRQFGGDDGAIGKTVFLDAKPYTVVGVMPALFSFPQGAQIWIPLRVAGIPIDDPVKQSVSVAARIKKGVSLQQVQTVLREIATRLSNAEPVKYKGHGLWAESIAKSRVSWVRNALWLLFGAVGFVLLIACANVGNLFLARGCQRQKEFSVRAALGATRGRIARQLLVESVVIAVFGGMLGSAFAIGCVGVLRSIAPPEIPRIDQLHVDGNVFLFTLVVSILAGILFGLIPASQISKGNLNSALKDEKPQLAGIRAKLRIPHVRDVLTTSEVALCLVLLVGSTLAMRSFLNLLDVNPGFRTDHILSMRIAPPKNKYPKREQMIAVEMQMVDKVRTVPGVAAASLKINGFMDGFDLGDNFRVIGSDGIQTEQDLQSRFVASDFFKTLRIPVLQGRVFDQRDDHVKVPVAVVNETLAKRFFPGKSPLGGHIVEEGFGGQPDTLREIVGEVSDVRDRDLSVAPAPTIYTPYLQSPYSVDLAFLLIRTAVAPAALTKSIEEQIWSVDKDVPIEEVETIDQKVSELVVEPKFRALLLGAFAGLGLTLALIGIFGVVSYSVGQRTREIGIRIALGAQRRNVFLLVLAGGMLPVIIGIAIGTAGALALTRLIQTYLYEIKPTDPLSYFAVALVFCATALLACYQPARRATRVDPMVALRHE